MYTLPMLPPAPTTWAEVPGYVRAVLDQPFVKKADGLPGLSHLVDVLGWKATPDAMNANWGGPRPLVNTLVGAGLGSLGGYAAGRLAETFLPERYFEPGAARRRGAILGGVLGGLPGAYQSFAAVREADGDLGALVRPVTGVVPKSAYDDAWQKAAHDLFAPQINVDRFSSVVYGDPNTPPRYQAALMGALEAADRISDRDRWISAFDIGRVAAGAGVGLISGVVAGKALGLLFGLTPDAQKKIQDVGLWGGAIKALVPQITGLL